MSDSFITDPVGPGEPSLLQRLQASPLALCQQAQQRIVGLTYHRDLLNQTVVDLRVALTAATAECERLRAENAQLRKNLANVCDQADEYVGMGWDFNDESEHLTAAIDAARKECLPKNSPT